MGYSSAVSALEVWPNPPVVMILPVAAGKTGKLEWFVKQ